MLKKVAVVIWSIFGVLFVLTTLLLFVGNDEQKDPQEPQLVFDQDKYNELEKALIADSNGSVIKIKRNGRLFDVTLHDDWYALSTQDKKDFTKTLYTKIRGMAIQSKLINHRADLDVILLDSTGEKVAHKKTFSDGWEIK